MIKKNIIQVSGFNSSRCLANVEKKKLATYENRINFLVNFIYSQSLNKAFQYIYIFYSKPIIICEIQILGI